MAGTFEESISDVDSELGLTGGPLELNEANVLAVQVPSDSMGRKLTLSCIFVIAPFDIRDASSPKDQLKAEIASLQKWLAECDPHSEESNSNVVKEVVC